jgi:dienelactone hydrolase
LFLAFLVLRRLLRVFTDRLAVAGGSLGGQAALLVGATFPEVRAVVSIVGSGLIAQGISGDGFLAIMRNHIPPWTWQGEPLPFLQNTVTPELERRVVAGETIRMIESFLPAVEDPELVAAATIPVERIHGPVLLISAGDDRTWPCEQLSEIARNRLAAHDHHFEYLHLHYPDAGHLLLIPSFAPTTESLEAGPGVTLDLGGTPAATAAAREATWTQTLDFLERSLCD